MGQTSRLGRAAHRNLNASELTPHLAHASAKVHFRRASKRPALAEDPQIPELARELFAQFSVELTQLQLRLKKVDGEIKVWHRQNERSQRLAQIPDVGPFVASMLSLKTPDPSLFKSARHFAAWIGLTPKDHSSGGTVNLGGITRAGDETLRSVLITGATAVVRQIRMQRGPHWP